MFRRVLACTLVAILLLVLFITHRSVRTSYVNGIPPYTDLPGREFIFERDCYIFKLKDEQTDWPYVAANTTVPGLPAEVTARNVGADLPNIRILGIVAIGDLFKILSVRRDERGGHSTITYEIQFLDEDAHKYPRLDARWMLDHTEEKPGPVPRILADYAVPRRSR
jgi:hypothetical protein